MRKASALNFLMLLLSLAGAAAAFVFGELLLSFVSYLPYWVQSGVYLLFIMLVCCGVMVISEKIHSGGYLLKHRGEFGITSGKAALIFLPTALVLGIVTQLLYGWVFSTAVVDPDFQGTMIVCDISGSMEDNDPGREMVEAIAAYIDTVPLEEHLGIVLFNHEITSLRKYAPLKNEAERKKLKELVYNHVLYSGGTDINTALLEAINEMRELENPNWPGLILFFSDGGRGDCIINYDLIRNAAVGTSGKLQSSIPVNTIYYSASPLSGSHMSLIAQNTGGEYYHVGVNDDPAFLREAFTRSRSEFELNNELHMIKYNIGPEGRTVWKIILRVLFLALWGALSGVFVVVFLNNSLLFKHFFIFKVIVSVVCGVIFTFIMLDVNTDVQGMMARAFLAFGMCVMYLPTYRWN